MADDTQTQPETPEAQAPAAPAAPTAEAQVPVPEKTEEAAVPQQLRLIGGEIHIRADARTGAISVNAPPNMIVALGLMEVAKAILIQKQQEQLREIEAMRKRIARPGDVDLTTLVGRKPS